MRKIIFTALITIFVFSFCNAQIKFENNLYTKVLKKAKEQNKLLFVAFCCDRCTPCKMMEDYVYNRKDVGDIYNEKFICWHTNVSQDPDGKKLGEKYNVNCFPTFLWIDPNDEEMFYKASSSKRPENFLKLGKHVDKMEIGVGKLFTDFENNKANYEVISKILDYYNYEEDKKGLLEFEKTLVKIYGIDFQNEKISNIYFQKINCRESQLTQYLLKNKRKIIKLYGKTKVYNKIASLK